MPSETRGKLSKREWEKKGKPRTKGAIKREARRQKGIDQRKALTKVYRSGFDKYGKRIDFSDEKTERGLIY